MEKFRDKRLSANLRIILSWKLCATERMRMVCVSMLVLAYFWLIFLLIVLIVVDKTRLPVSRRLGPFPEFLRGKMDQIGWWLVALFYPLLPKSQNVSKFYDFNYGCFPRSRCRLMKRQFSTRVIIVNIAPPTRVFKSFYKSRPRPGFCHTEK